MSRRIGLALLLGTLAGAAPVAAPIGAQTAPVPAPPIEASIRTWIETAGIVVVTRLSRLDPVALGGGGRLHVSAVGAFEPGQEQKRVLGIRLDLEAPGLTTEQGRHYLDVHEVEGLLGGIFLLEQVAAEAREGFENEADYETVEGFAIGVTVSGGKIAYWVEGGRGVRARLPLARTHVTTLRQRLELARTRLFTD